MSVGVDTVICGVLTIKEIRKDIGLFLEGHFYTKICFHHSTGVGNDNSKPNHNYIMNELWIFKNRSHINNIKKWLTKQEGNCSFSLKQKHILSTFEKWETERTRWREHKRQIGRPYICCGYHVCHCPGPHPPSRIFVMTARPASFTEPACTGKRTCVHSRSAPRSSMRSVLEQPYKFMAAWQLFLWNEACVLWCVTPVRQVKCWNHVHLSGILRVEKRGQCFLSSNGLHILYLPLKRQ